MESRILEDNSGEHEFCPVNISSFFERGLDEEAFGVVFPIFAQETPERVQQCYTALRKNDLKQLRSLAHAIKGSAANVAAYELSDTAKMLQIACEQDRHSQVAELVDELKQKWIQLEAYAIEKRWITPIKCESD